MQLGMTWWRGNVSIGSLFEMGSSSQVQRSHQQQGKKSDTEYREKSHPHACSKRETLTIYPPVYGPAALLLWIKVHDLKFSCHSSFMFKLTQDAPLLQSLFSSTGRSIERLTRRSIGHIRYFVN